MNKRAILILGVITLFCGAAYFGTKLTGPTNENVVADEMIVNKNETVKQEISETINTSVDKEKTTPNTVLTLKKIYTDCGHTIVDKSEIPEEMVNLTKEELEEKYTNWRIDDFSKDEVVLTKELASFCGEHYLIVEEGGEVLVYSLDEANNKTLIETTDIAFEYLTETDKIILKNGIYVYGKDEVNKIREDFE